MELFVFSPFFFLFFLALALVGWGDSALAWWLVLGWGDSALGTFPFCWDSSVYRAVGATGTGGGEGLETGSLLSSLA